MAAGVIGKVEDFFYLEQSFGCLISFTKEGNTDFKIGDKIKLVTPQNEVVETFIKGIPMICRRLKEDKTPDFKLISIEIDNTERNIRGFPKGTEIYLIGENV
jgi:hypothetical protein